VGIWPLESPVVGTLERLRERIDGYMLKAAREAKRRTSWTDPDPDFEAALSADIQALFSPARSPRFLDDLDRWAATIGRAGYWTSAARVLLHLASPGIPDIYQGDELWNLALVDPDNRRVVDYAGRAELLDDIGRGWASGGLARRRFLTDMAQAPEDGRLKLHLIRAGLAARRRCPAAFGSPAYLPLTLSGPAAGRVVAFARGEGRERLIVAAPRLFGAEVTAGGTAPTDPVLWEDTFLPIPPGWPGQWVCALSGEPITAEPQGLRLASLFAVLPAALLLAEELSF
jgi:(1->4)-alpha-D-glucan 1-alpha-D-glucosylmutase